MPLQRAAKNKRGRKVISIQGSGTRFLCELLKCDHVHIGHRKEVLEGVYACPLRDPKAVWLTWQKRWNMKGPYGGFGFTFQDAWETLNAIDYPIWHIPLDRPEREQQIIGLSEVLQEDLNPDWNELVGHANQSKKNKEWWADNPVSVDWDYIYSIPLVAKFYAVGA